MRPEDERDGEPYYIDGTCNECGTDLVQQDEDSHWNDEWECPDCQDGVYMDWPSATMEQLKRRAEQHEFEPLSLEEIKEDIDNE